MTAKPNVTIEEADVAADPGQGSLAQYVYNQLRQEIRSGQLGSNERLREADIAQRLAVSRTPVREALKRLEAEGMVRFAPPRGYVVVQLSPKQVMELYAMRKVLVGAAARFAAEHASAIEIQSMQQMLVQLERAKAPDEVAALNRRLHDIIIAAAHNEYLFKTSNVLIDALALLGTTTYSMPGRIKSGLKENREIVACIARHDADAAERTAQAHVAAATELRLKMMFGDKSGLGVI
ncbi:GntR family transcriptional regulator (plasmid) [Paraburkholderia sp. PREW-6R]|uniref:GntR family transcriptional regulator n=1 Tax=Paraburkholderia sp. PREW-6R TaxID=3141544 RepID=UPI0031F57C68